MIIQNTINHLHLLSAELAWKYRIIPTGFDDDTVTVLTDDNQSQDDFKEELEIIIGYKINFKKETSDKITELLATHYRKNTVENDKGFISTLDIDNNVLSKLIIEAKSLHSSDIHIESFTNKKRIRLRIDGKLIERYRLPADQYSSLINKIKIRAQLDIAEKRLPQDGRMCIIDNNLKIDIRVSILPTLHGEKVVLRLLNNDADHISLETIGFDAAQREIFTTILKRPHGIILISGPTGSGKTTTLYATLKMLNSEQNNILTIEDPIEYTLNGVNQVQLRESIGLTFASALRTFLRQDPDIIMLGEIRDSETAQMAIRAALTGHLVLSTIHTNSAWSTISRLIDMGIPSFLLASTINMTAAQRLVRKLCPECKQAETGITDNNSTIRPLFKPLVVHFVQQGCKKCFYTGYSGRVAIFEVIPVDSEISSMIKDNIQDISIPLQQRKIFSLKDHAIQLVENGITSIEEVYPILINN